MSIASTYESGPRARVDVTSLNPAPTATAQPARGRGEPEHSSSDPLHQRRKTLYYIVVANLVHDYAGGTSVECWRVEGSEHFTSVNVHHSDLDPRMSRDNVPELLFELFDEAHARGSGQKARARIACGVRRVVGIFFDEGEVREWSPAEEAWLVLDRGGVLSDPLFTRPIPIATLLDPTVEEVDDVFDRYARRKVALQRKAEAEAAAVEAEQEEWLGRWRKGCIAVLDELCAHLGVSMNEAERTRMEGLDQEPLMYLFNEIFFTRRIPRWLGQPSRLASSTNRP